MLAPQYDRVAPYFSGEWVVRCSCCLLWPAICNALSPLRKLWLMDEASRSPLRALVAGDGCLLRYFLDCWIWRMKSYPWRCHICWKLDSWSVSLVPWGKGWHIFSSCFFLLTAGRVPLRTCSAELPEQAEVLCSSLAFVGYWSFLDQGL